MRNFKITVNGNQYDVTVEETGSANMPKPTPVEQNTTEKTPAPVKVSAGGTEVKAPMPGMVLDFKVSDGATVKKGGVIMVLEAMKMENDISAPCDGNIKFVATKGANVETGDTLAVIV